MRDALVVADVHDPADVHGVHDSDGLSRWACLSRRTGLYGGWEAVEWAWLPAGGVSGEHLHSRTEEVYFLLHGRGEIHLDGRPHAVRAGDAVLTGLGARHALHNTGRRPLSWLVVELPAPTRVGAGPYAVPHQSPRSQGESPVTTTPRSAVVRDLRGHGPLDAAEVLTGPLRTVGVRDLPPHAGVELAARGTEHTVFVLSGTGTARSADREVPLASGTALTLPLGGAVRLWAGDGGMEYFHAVLDVPLPEEGWS
ncbi:cupin domain-containing protein [Streptomyces sp. NBC_01275]|uniref:cupin domain-containing protein n=1 Tax=Streptomyces sp. NBC_01275 TaxID=2903807 RepID=UPI00224E6F29|nr:cupin domain-containing protein [Streptomyces sp. NBC_01275]MCX4766567.1 cupin domain-containing protein [Streptomyces sp. NBC_01275]